MVDITHDPRWGRIMEGSGEDPFLGSVMASARVKGFQGDNIKDKTKIAACSLSYTSFSCKNIKVDKNQINKNEFVTVSVEVSNTGKVSGEEVVQLYIQDEVASVTRPVKELKGFQKIKLKPGETKTVNFKILSEMLSFLDKDLKPVVEPGKFNVMIGGNSVDLVSTSFEVME